MNAKQRYHLKHRESELARMKERARLVREEERELAKEDPEVAEQLRQRWRESYHKRMENKNKKQIEEWIQHPLVNILQKQLLRILLREETYKTMGATELSALKKMIDVVK